MIWLPRLSKDIGHATSSEYLFTGLRTPWRPRGLNGSAATRSLKLGGQRSPRQAARGAVLAPPFSPDGFQKGMIPWNHQARQVTCVRWIGLRKKSLRFPLSDHAQRGRSWGVTRITGARAFALCPRSIPRCPPLGASSIRTKNKKNRKHKHSKNIVVVVSVYRCVCLLLRLPLLCSI